MLTFWSIKYIHNREYKIFAKWKDSKIVCFVDFSNKRRFGLNKYVKFLCEMKLRQITKRSNHLEAFRKKGALKNITKFTWKHLCWSPFFDKVACLRPETLLKRDSNTGIFRWILWSFLRTPFLQNSSAGCFFIKDLFLSIFCNKKSFRQFYFNLLA